MKPTFSIVTATYNRAKLGYLEKCIESVQKQKLDGFSYEHIIIDDGSTDGTAELIKKFQKNDARIKYFYQENQGPGRSFEIGIGHAEGKYFFKLDDDDELSTNALKNRYDYIQKHPDIDWFYALAEWIDEFGLPTEQLYQSRYYKDFAYERMLVSNYIHTGTETVRTSIAKNLEWPEWLVWSQDYFLWLELLRPERNLKYGFMEKVVLRYRYHSNSYTANLDSDIKKARKNKVNLQIKNLHPAELVFLAEEAFNWSEATTQLKHHMLKQREPLEQEIRELKAKAQYLEDLLHDHRYSKVIGPVLKFRRKAQAGRRKSKALINAARTRTVSAVHQKAKAALHGQRVGVTHTAHRTVNNDKWEGAPLVSIVTPFYNRAHTMPETIRSVLKQTFQDFEYIVVDDGSPDSSSQAYLRKIRHHKIKIVYQENQGVAVARNTGIALAKGKYIVCLDSDDVIEETYLEKAVAILESDPTVSIVSYDTQMFGIRDDEYRYPEFNPFTMMVDNLLLTASVFRKEAWVATGGYKDRIGYEDWEFWVNAIKNGHFAKHVPETLFKYRTAEESRYVVDLMDHHKNARYIRNIHPHYEQRVRSLLAKRSMVKEVVSSETAFTNLKYATQYTQENNGKKNVLIAVPWMPFGGAETLVLNFSRQLKARYNITFMTGLKAPHEWEYKFKEITPNVYHLANLFDSEQLKLEFVSNYIRTRNIALLHIVHTSHLFDMLPELKRRHPSLRIVVTVFNDRAHFNESVEAAQYVDAFSTDNNAVVEHYKYELVNKQIAKPVKLIPNGIDCRDVFKPQLFDRKHERFLLGLNSTDTAVFFIGRLSEEKNPDIFVSVAKNILVKKQPSNVKFFIIGDGPMRGQIEEAIKDAGSPNIRYLGYQTDIARFLSAADVFMLPSSIEGFPLSILEAMAMGVAVVASRVGAIPDVITEGKNGLIATPGNTEDFTDKLSTLLQDPTMLKAIKKEARKTVETKYSSDMLGKNYTELYEGV